MKGLLITLEVVGQACLLAGSGEFAIWCLGGINNKVWYPSWGLVAIAFTAINIIILIALCRRASRSL